MAGRRSTAACPRTLPSWSSGSGPTSPSPKPLEPARPALARAIGQKADAALAELGAKQGQALEAERPVPRFLRGLLALLSTGNAVLVDPIAAGVDEPPTMLGWADAEWLYLGPEASYRAVARFYRDAGEPYPLRQGRLFQELAEAKLSDPGRDAHPHLADRRQDAAGAPAPASPGRDPARRGVPGPWRPPPPPSNGGFP